MLLYVKVGMEHSLWPGSHERLIQVRLITRIKSEWDDDNRHPGWTCIRLLVVWEGLVLNGGLVVERFDTRCWRQYGR